MKNIKFAMLVMLCSTSTVHAGEQLVNQAKNVGIKSCLSTISDLENFFTKKDTNYGSWSVWANDKPNSQIFTSSLEITYSDGPAIVDLTVAPTKDNQCSYSYTRTWYSNESCMAFTKSSMPNSATYKSELNKFVTLFDDGSVKWLLSNAGIGCLIQKKEFGIRYKAQAL